jgi:hypothetical protein
MLIEQGEVRSLVTRLERHARTLPGGRLELYW